MKKLVIVSTLIGIVALLILLVVGSAAAAPPLQLGPGEGEREIEPEIEPGGGLPGEGEPEPGGGGPSGADPSLQEDGADSSGTAVRINFEVGGHSARRGLYVVKDLGGKVLASWNALDGWKDSGWISILDIPRKAIWVEVFYFPGPNTQPTAMRIVNHAPGTAYGWISQGIGHAIEVAWPGIPLRSDVMTVRPDGMPVTPDSMAWRPYGMVARPYGMAWRPYGMAWRPYGMMVRPDGMVVTPAG